MEEIALQCDPSMSQLRWSDKLGVYWCHQKPTVFIPVKLNCLRGWEGKPLHRRSKDQQNILSCPSSISALSSYNPMGILHEEGIPEGRRIGRLPRATCKSSPEALRGTPPQRRAPGAEMGAVASFYCMGIEASHALPSLSLAADMQAWNKGISFIFLAYFIDVCWQL